MSNRPTYVTNETTIGEFQEILRAHNVPQLGLNVTDGRWSAVIRRRDGDEVAASQGASLSDVLDGVIGIDAMVAEL